MEIAIEDAQPSHCAALTGLAIRSKAHWGYDDAFMAQCRDELTVTADCFGAEFIRIAVCQNELCGFYRLSYLAGYAEIEALFVDPRSIGMGVGRALLKDLIVKARSVGAKKLTCHSDPNAEKFYLAMGMQRAGEVSSGSIPGRFLPMLTLKL